MKLPETLGQQFQVLAHHNFTLSNLTVHWDNKPISLTPKQINQENQYWDQAHQDPKITLYNGKLCHLRHVEISQNAAILTLGPIDYKTHLHFIMNPEKQNAPDLPDLGLGVSSVIISKDNQILFMKRSEVVATYPSKYDVFGGHIEIQLEVPVESIPNPFSAIRKELYEELHLQENQIDILEGIGLIKNNHTNQPELIFKCITTLDSKDLVEQTQNATDKIEYSEIFCLNNHRDIIQAFCLQNALEFSPSGLGNIWVHSLQI